MPKRLILLVVLLLMLPICVHAETIYWASDLHYISQTLCTDDDVLAALETKGDGCLVKRRHELVSAFFQIVLDNHPDALILSGDLTYNGEWEAHKALRDMLLPLHESGIRVLVIPGNHDINTQAAYRYVDGRAVPDRDTTLDDFHAIYDLFAYNEALSTAPASYSYLFPLSENVNFLMLDVSQYTPIAAMGGYLTKRTREFASQALAMTNSTVISVSHQNLFQHSSSFSEGYVMEKADDLIAILKANSVKLHLSGHMHNMHQYTQDGITEMLVSALPMTPCQYGVIQVQDDVVSIEMREMTTFSEDAAKLHYDKTANRLFTRLSITDIPFEVQEILVDYCSRLNVSYFLGYVPESYLTEDAHSIWYQYALENASLARYQMLLETIDEGDMRTYP